NSVVIAIAPISFDLAITDPNCTNVAGKIGVINLSGGSGGGFLYSKNGGDSFQQDSLFSDLDTGSYNIVVMDSLGCTSNSKAAIIKLSSSTLKATASVSNIGCDQSAGSVTVVATGGEPPYRYRLDGGNYQSSGSFGNLAVGQHTIRVKDSAGCDFDLQFDVKQTGSKPDLVVTNPPVLCPGSTLNLKDTVIVHGSDKDLAYTFWTDSSATTAVANPTAVTGGTYFIKATNKEGCSAIKPVVVTVHTLIPGRISASGPTNICPDQSVSLTASSGMAYQWYRNDTAIAGATEAVYLTSLAGVYSVKINDGTCTAFASNTIQVVFRDCTPPPDTNVFVPSGFTPNTNGANDVLRPLLYNIATLAYFKVYNRWGQLVFQTSAIGKGWDGTIKGVAQPTDAYTWILECTDNNGKKIKQSGRSLLIR
ncbi:MAG TPA: gliding motility-associated C-terminal domain-containing protein, partial [Flavisolibacter sp.]|nr:gliding motility-associated C-terminal domain-containing protein [Flavisolibacter sp.]